MNRKLADFAKHLVARKVLSQSTLNLQEHPSQQRPTPTNDTTAYCGFDPTARHLHLGNYLQIVTLSRAALFGIRPIYLLGGATALIGDPSGKLSARAQLNTETVDANLASIETDFAQLLANLFSHIGKVAPESRLDYTVLNNRDFYKDVSMIDFLLRYGSHLNMATLLRKETVSRRLEAEQPFTFAEFSYQVFQAIDFLILNQRHVSQAELRAAARRQRPVGQHPQRHRADLQGDPPQGLRAYHRAPSERKGREVRKKRGLVIREAPFQCPRTTITFWRSTSIF